MKEPCQHPDHTRLQRRVEELEAELAQLTYAISHDLRAPLRAVSGFSAAVLEDFGATLQPTARTHVERVAAAGRRMESLIQGLLAYSRLSKGEIVLGPVELEAAVEEASGPHLDHLRARGGAITVEPSLPRVLGEPSMLVLALAAILDNALKFVEGPPQVRVRAEPRGSDVRLWIEDNGIGIAPEQHERIFGVFERLYPSERYPGTGMGLALARRAVGRLSGRTGVESSPGQGSRFWIELPSA